VLGIVGAVVSFWLLAGGFASAELAGPDTTGAPLVALQSLAGGAVIGAVLLAGRTVSPSAPLTCGLAWAIVSVVGLADPALLDLGSPGARSLMAHQLGLGLAALLLAGTAAVQPTRAPAPSYRAPSGPEPPITQAGTYRPATGPRRPNGPGPRHRAPAPRWSPPRVPRVSPVPAPRRPLPPHRPHRL
jgi:hypothetical protein